MHVSQIFLSDDENGDLSPFLKHATEAIDQQFPDADHVIYDKRALRRFIEIHYEKDVVWAYDALRPYAYKSDLGRYCLLNTLGGWYVDIAIRLINTVNLGSEVEGLAFRELQCHSLTSWACSTGLLYSKPDNVVLQTAIRLIVEHCKQKYYGITPLCPTGPTLFGRALAINGSNARFIFGDHLELTPAHPYKNRAFVLLDGTILGWTKPCAGGDLEGVGANGVNNYNVFWRNRTVYG